jgi:ubiquinone/menaquinone biosynthesis C-methylase UbiE
MREPTWSRLRFVEEGSAFAALEGAVVRARAEARGDSRKEVTMTNISTDTTSNEHAAPREAWDAIAAGYDSFVTAGEEATATEALRLAGLKAGDRFLDVAAGSGGLSLPAARLGATVLATDWSPEMIERFRSRVRDQGLQGAEGRVMDCHQLSIADDSFDVTGSQFGVMLVPDQAQALREMVRVTKPGGRVVLIAYGSPAEFEALHCFIGALQAVVPGFEGMPDDPPPLEFQVADPEVLQQRLREAGLRDVAVDTAHQERLEIRSGEELWNWCLGSNPIPNLLVAELTAEQKAAVIRELDRVIAERTKDGKAAILTAPLNIGIGTK